MKAEKPSKSIFIVIFALFFISALVGYLIGITNLNSAQDYIDSQTNFIDGFISLKQWELFGMILLNNAFKAFLAIYLSILFGFFAVYFVSMNGYLLGMFAAVVLKSEGISFFVLGILPHGIFELPMILIASGYGLWIGMKFYRRIYFKEKKELYDALKFAGIRYLKIILPVLFLAALIEVFVTPLIMSKFS